MGISKYIVYRLISRGRIVVDRSAGIIRIPRVEYMKMAKCFLERLKRRKEREGLRRKRGISGEAARKRVYRRYGRMNGFSEITKGS